jgi:hypothetical protein
MNMVRRRDDNSLFICQEELYGSVIFVDDPQNNGFTLDLFLGEW